jgi:ribonucleoside-diphosphate reductase alpha chain
MHAVEHGEGTNLYRSDATKFYGLETARHFEVAKTIAEIAVKSLTDAPTTASTVAPTTALTVESVQDAVEKTLLTSSEANALLVSICIPSTVVVAASYIRYRTEHAMRRPRRFEYSSGGLRDYILMTRYCRVIPRIRRRETWSEAVDRVCEMHLRRFASILDVNVSAKDAILKAFNSVKHLQVLPSMRSIQFGGAAIEANEARIFNCSASVVNRMDFFKEYFFLLLSGCGVGFSVQKHHVACLPPLAPRPSDELTLIVRHFIIPDTLEGWCEALNELITSYVNGYKVEFAYHQIRNRGQMLVTSGGRAPGHIPLKNALAKVDAILTASTGRRLRPIEVYDICMHVAQSVLAGGIRRSATICLFSPDDDEMMTAKTGDWFATNPQRSASNNSAVIIRSDAAARDNFNRLFQCQKQFGEPGFYFSDFSDYVTNPCCEIGLNPFLGIGGDEETGFQMCNLTTTNGAKATTPEIFYGMCRDAAVIGTLQASYTNIPYLGPITKALNEREALLGVSICGILDNPDVFLNQVTLETGAQIVRETNAWIASVIGIRPAARTTCVKPEGTASLVLEAASGIHPHHAKRYIRRVQAATADPVYKFFKQRNPHLCEPSVYGERGASDVISFPVEAPTKALLRRDVTALQLLEYVKFVQQHWVCAGRAYETFSPGLHHNVSNTISVATDEWDSVADFIWTNRADFTGVAMLAVSGDKDYQQAPREEIATDADILRWNRLVVNPFVEEYAASGVVEEDASTGSSYRGAAIACNGNACELVSSV